MLNGHFIDRWNDNCRLLLRPIEDMNKTEALELCKLASPVAFGDYRFSKWDGYQISPLFRNLKNAFEKEKRKLWLEAFKSPKLYSDLIEKFDAHELPTELTTHLIRYHDIAEKAAPAAADIFIKNAQYCGVLNENNVLTFKQTFLKVSNPNLQYAEVITEDKNNEQQDIPLSVKTIEVEQSNLIKSNAPEQQSLLKEMVNEEKIKIRLTGKRFAYLIYPDNLNRTDIEILKKQIEQLELIAE